MYKHFLERDIDQTCSIINRYKTQKAVVEQALQVLIRLRGQEELRSLRGKLRWEGDLNELREGRFDNAG